METAVFIVCALIVLGGAIGVVMSRNPVHAALSLVATLFAIAVVGAVVLSRRPKDLQPIPEPESMTEQGDDPLTMITEENAH